MALQKKQNHKQSQVNLSGDRIAEAACVSFVTNTEETTFCWRLRSGNRSRLQYLQTSLVSCKDLLLAASWSKAPCAGTRRGQQHYLGSGVEEILEVGLPIQRLWVLGEERASLPPVKPRTTEDEKTRLSSLTKTPRTNGKEELTTHSKQVSRLHLHLGFTL